MALLWRRYGWLERTFPAALLLWILLSWVAPASAFRSMAEILAFFLGAGIFLRYSRRGVRKTIWSLRNRLYVTYLFIAVVPICLILLLALIGVYILTGQVGVYLVSSELERRTVSLRNTAEFLLNAPETRRSEALREVSRYFSKRFPGMELLIRDQKEIRIPPDASIVAPPPGWGTVSGILERDHQLYVWAHAEAGDRDVTLLAPLTPEILSGLVPQLGEVTYMTLAEDGKAQPARKRRLGIQRKTMEQEEEGARDALPPPANRFDIVVDWFTLTPVAVWEQPLKMRNVVISVRTRFSAVFRVITGEQADFSEKFAGIIFAAVAILFLVVELVSLIIGVNLTRTITSAVHDLYEGTQKIRQGDFSHRIRAKGQDQLAELSSSFNRMTENIERLLEISKEKERLQAELELAREVQAQLYPKTVPALKTLKLLAACNPARMVSGDYFDYQPLLESKVALALGDVAGKGISAALLMATVGSCLRTQIRHCLDAPKQSGNGELPMPVSQLVAQLNKQIYQDSAPEKYLTFFFAVYDDASSLLTYTNAGHLPPLLIRNGQVTRLDVNGTVVGAFPFAQYGESAVELISGDLLVCYTDGITEPENEYGEMFGEDRLIDVLLRNAERDESELVNAVMDAVRSWTASSELQDDMTMLVARRV